MLAIKSLCLMCFLLGIISEVYSSEYLNFGVTDDESSQAENYVSADSGAKTGPTDELIRTQRSFWKLLKHRLFGECGNYCNNFNYNLGNGQNCNVRPALLQPFQPWQPLPLWQTLKPLFPPVNYDNCGANNYAGGNGNPPSYGLNVYSDNGNNNSPSYHNVQPAPEPVYEIPTELPPARPDYQVDNATEDTYKPASKSVGTETSYSAQEMPTYPNDDIANVHLHSNGKLPQILYQPIIYVSPQYLANKALNQVKQEETKYGEQYKEYGKPHELSYEMVSDEESKRNFDKTKSDNSFKETSAVVTPCQTVPFTDASAPSLSHPPIITSIPPISTVYNIIAPSSIHSLTTGQSPYIDSVVPNVLCSNEPPSKYSLYPSNCIPLNNYPLAAPTRIGSLPVLHPVKGLTTAAPPVSTYVNPIQLTADDQPYRVCPELFEEYQRQLTTILPHIYDGSSFVNIQHTQY